MELWLEVGDAPYSTDGDLESNGEFYNDIFVQMYNRSTNKIPMLWLQTQSGENLEDLFKGHITIGIKDIGGMMMVIHLSHVLTEMSIGNLDMRYIEDVYVLSFQDMEGLKPGIIDIKFGDTTRSFDASEYLGRNFASVMITQPTIVNKDKYKLVGKLKNIKNIYSKETLVKIK